MAIRGVVDSHHLTLQNRPGIFDQVERALIRDISIQVDPDVILASIEAVLAALAYYRIAAIAGVKREAGAFALDGRRSKNQVDPEVARDVLEKLDRIFELLEDSLRIGSGNNGR